MQRLTVALALSVAVSIPSLFFAHQREYEGAAIRTEAEINARLFADLINRSPEFWQFQTDQLESLLARRSAFGNAAENRRILALDGALIAQSLDDVPTPRLSTREPLMDAGTPVAWLQIERSLRPALWWTALVALGAGGFGLLLYLGVSRLPLRALEDAMAQLNEERDKALLTLRSIGDAVVTTDSQQRVEYLNPVAEQLSGWRNEEARGQPIQRVLNLRHADSHAEVTNPVQECLATLKIVELTNHTVLVRKGDGAEIHIEDSAAPIVGRQGRVVGAIMVFHDVSDRVRTQQQLQHTAFHDALTGLPNRDLFRKRLGKALDEAVRKQRKVAVLFLDLDRFKQVNDSLGHSVGDELLVAAAKRIRHCVRESDVVCRLGGDEFTALLVNIEGQASALAVGEKILEALSRPFNIQQHQMRIGASVGVALFPDHGEGVEDLLKNADTAMYEAKEAGRNNVKVYAAAMNALAGERLRMSFALQMAMERDEYRIVYQPKQRLGDGKVVGVEALLRWQSAELGAVGPADFVSHLEGSGAIVEVGRWVLKNAIRQARRWVDAGRPLSVAVNVSAVQFKQAGLVSDIATLLHEIQLPPSLLQLELTESLLMSDMQHSQFVIAELTQLGVQLSLDDFGTGFSSLGYLRRFAVQELKIDRCFVHELHSSTAAESIVRTVIELGHALGMSVTAEGVETSEQAERLRAMGCDQMQGYWLARPMAMEQLEIWLAAH